MRLTTPKLTRWDLLAIAIASLAAGLAIVNWMTAGPSATGSPVTSRTTLFFVSAQLLLSICSLFALGKTAREGTLLGNLSAVLGSFLGVWGGLLAAAIWVAG